MGDRGRERGARPRRYDSYTSLKHRYIVRQFFEQNPNLIRHFTKRWVDRLLSPLRCRDDVEPLFWALVNPVSQDRLIESLRYVAKQGSIRRVISALKDTDRSSMSTTSLTKRARWFSGTQSDSDGGSNSI